MQFWHVVGFGALGGLLVELVAFHGRLLALQAKRSQKLGKRGKLPGLRDSLDPLVDTAVALSRIGLGAGAAALLAQQVSGSLAAVLVGSAAPALFRQFGAARSVADAEQQATELEQQP
ncbi:hypothetical protein [Nonomuraea sp. B19D2]|uniref:hypothetical protein n=1 Tax=Nonomuraea sp. B19D2 TaxID=3159561 RepID=UPI0032DB2F28